MKLPELLAPAGNMERLMTAFHFGADAVYVGMNKMSLRNFADNFTLEELKIACDYAHKNGKKIYVACNAFGKDDDFEELAELIKGIYEAGADAIIVNDPGVIYLAKQVAPKLELHLSTQANTLNSYAAKFWYDQGVKRVILARELSLKQISDMKKKMPDDLELEIFVHGAMCISYSGRCLLSNYLAGRDANRGECVQPCRWSYELREKGKEGEFFPIEQDEKGTYILNSRDMNLIEHLPEVIASGACSLKIEGRMKSIAYVATVVNAYRMALDEYKKAMEEGSNFVVPEIIVNELYKTSHRPYSTGFMFGSPGAEGQYPIHAGYIKSYDICATVIDYDKENHIAKIQQRNRFFDGEELDILSPGDVGRKFTVKGIKNEDGEYQEATPHPKQILFIGCDEEVKCGDILRKKYN